MQYFVYIMASRRNGTLYIGVTRDLSRRVYQHRHNSYDGFTQKYDVKNLVYYEAYDDIQKAMVREKQMKKWNRQWKMRLIDKYNPEWEDLYKDITV